MVTTLRRLENSVLVDHRSNFFHDAWQKASVSEREIRSLSGYSGDARRISRIIAAPVE